MYFRNVEDFGDLDFQEETNGDVIITSTIVITVGENEVTVWDKVKILASAYAEGRYVLHYGLEDTLLGNLHLKTTADGGGEEARGGDGVDTLQGGSGAEIFWGLEGSDIIEGGGGDDILYGAAGDDRLYGGDGNDENLGWWGADTLEGGGGLIR